MNSGGPPISRPNTNPGPGAKTSREYLEDEDNTLHGELEPWDGNDIDDVACTF
jgi:hypothetical protein